MSDADYGHAPQGHAVHVMPPAVLLAVWGGLVVRTVVTVLATRVDLGSLNLWLALAIATCKASLVALYFMHLRYEKPFNAIVLISALLFVMLFVGLAMMDTESYHPELIPDYAPGMQK